MLRLIALQRYAFCFNLQTFWHLFSNYFYSEKLRYCFSMRYNKNKIISMIYFLYQIIGVSLRGNIAISKSL